MASPAPPPKTATAGVCVFSGGTGANFLVDAFNSVIEARRCPLAYVIPISDNGGSSSEIIRVFGGPSVGDVRSRLVRLIPTDSGGDDGERTALRSLFGYRLCADPHEARAEWLDIVEARHLLWTFVSSPKRELIRSVLNTLNMEIVKRARPTSVFDFSEASVGNLFLTGARLFSGSFESAVYLLSIICAIPDHVAVLPAINSNFTHHICAGLADGAAIAGQVNISHPSAPTALPDDANRGGGGTPLPPLLPPAGRKKKKLHARGGQAEEEEAVVEAEDANLPGSLPALRRQHIAFRKDAEDDDLPARIERIWYINPYGHEIRPAANPKVLAAVRGARAVVYSIGSLYTSIVPSLILRGVGAAIAAADEEEEDADEKGEEAGADADPDAAAPGPRHKVLILNSTVDRETGPRSDPMTAVDFVRAIARACRQSRGEEMMAGDDVEAEDRECRRYVTHLVHIEGLGSGLLSVGGGGGGAGRDGAAPAVDREALARLGIRFVGVRGRRDGAAVRYDEAELAEVLGRIIDS